MNLFLVPKKTNVQPKPEKHTVFPNPTIFIIKSLMVWRWFLSSVAERWACDKWPQGRTTSGTSEAWWFATCHTASFIRILTIWANCRIPSYKTNKHILTHQNGMFESMILLTCLVGIWTRSLEKRIPNTFSTCFPYNHHILFCDQLQWLWNSQEKNRNQSSGYNKMGSFGTPIYSEQNSILVLERWAPTSYK